MRNTWDDIAATILEDGDQKRCAKTLAADFPDVPKHDWLVILQELEPELRKMGFGSLSLLRTELERLHPAWGEA